jgi:hypothetical protein
METYPVKCFLEVDVILPTVPHCGPSRFPSLTYQDVARAKCKFVKLPILEWHQIEG